MKPTNSETSIGLPWYRQFWPWFLIALPGTVVVAALWTLVIANKHADDLVVDEYYKDGLAINRQLVRQQRAATLGIGAVLSLDGRNLRIATTGLEGQQQLRLVLSHPMEAERDLTLPLTTTGDGEFAVTLPLAIEGRWHWIIDAGDGSDWRLDGNQRF